MYTAFMPNSGESSFEGEPTRLRVGVLEILIPEAAPDRLRRLQCRYINRHYASIMPQAVSYWSRCLGHETHYATYWGQADAESLLPRDLDVVFVAACTNASTLAYALAKRYRSEGCFTVLGGPTPRPFPKTRCASSISWSASATGRSSRRSSQIARAARWCPARVR